MGTALKENALALIVRAHALRKLYAACRRVPILGSCLHTVVCAVLPPRARVWIRLPGGIAEGLWFYVDPRWEPAYLNADHEPWVEELLRGNLRQGNCFYDVGAHAGFFTLIAAQLVGNAGSVIAFEPDPDNARVLRANLTRNHLKQASVVEAAVWSSPGEVTFQRSAPEAAGSQGRVVQEARRGTEKITVRAVSLDDVIFGSKGPRPNMVKMDIEGGEWEALKGASRTLQEVRPDLFCEVHDRGELHKLRVYLEQLGYSVEHWAPVHPRYADYRQEYLWARGTRHCSQ